VRYSLQSTLTPSFSWTESKADSNASLTLVGWNPPRIEGRVSSTSKLGEKEEGGEEGRKERRRQGRGREEGGREKEGKEGKKERKRESGLCVLLVREYK